MSRDVDRTSWGTVHVSAVEHGENSQTICVKLKEEIIANVNFFLSYVMFVKCPK